MKRIRTDSSELKDNPWLLLSERFGISPCYDPVAFERNMLKIREPIILFTGGRYGYEREVLDILEAIQQKSDFVYIIWSDVDYAGSAQS